LASSRGPPCQFVSRILQEILDRTGYSLEITSGQRKYGGPPPNYDGPSPAPGQEVSSLFVIEMFVSLHCFGLSVGVVFEVNYIRHLCLTDESNIDCRTVM